MLKHLHLRDIAIVDELEVELGAGFTVLTGETGAGKSILIDALQLALGQRAEASVVRDGAQRAEVSAEFDTPPALRSWLEEAGFGVDDALLLRRSVDAQGRSRAWINGSAATASQLKALADELVDIHGQHAWQSLTRPDAVRQLLDDYARLDTQALRNGWAAWREALRTLDDARARQATLQQERERLQWQISEMDKLGPQSGEWEEMNRLHGRLAHAQGLIDAAQLSLAALDEDDDSADDREQNDQLFTQKRDRLCRLRSRGREQGLPDGHHWTQASRRTVGCQTGVARDGSHPHQPARLLHVLVAAA